MGHVIGAVVADTKSQAQRAAKMVKIEYEDLPSILTIEVNCLLCFFFFGGGGVNYYGELVLD